MRVLTLLMMVPLLGGYAFAQSSSNSSSDNSIRCMADARWANTNGSLIYSKQLQLPVTATLLAHVSKGTNCPDGEIRVSATYLTSSRDFICSGSIQNAMTTSSEAQAFNIEIRPFTQNDFLRWRNQPGVRGIQQGRELKCFNIDGSSEVGDVDRAKAAMIHLTFAVLPKGGGLAIAEALIQINP